MDLFADVDADTLLSGESDWVDDEFAERLARHPLDSIATEYPHHVRSVDGPDGVERPSERHPVFYGCYDWHSAAHSHWALVRGLRLFEGRPREEAVVESIGSRLTTENVAREVEVFEENPSFEKPYGWAWLLHLASELSLWDDPRAEEWRATLEPLETKVRSLVERDLLAGDRPFRVGTHGNTAFALHCVLDYARTTGDDALAREACETATRCYADDRDYPVEYEPLGWDFLSPALTEADLMRRVYGHDEFEAWLDGFLPDVTQAPYDAFLEPARVSSNPDEGVALHLVGLNLSKAWALAGVAERLDGHPYEEALERSARRHAERGLEEAFTEDYAGAHWLTSFALYLLTRNEGGVAPERG